MTERLLLPDPPTGKINTACNQSVQRSIVALCCLKQRHYHFIL
jgi:hypothetical protein